MSYVVAPEINLQKPLRDKEDLHSVFSLTNLYFLVNNVLIKCISTESKKIKPPTSEKRNKEKYLLTISWMELF